MGTFFFSVALGSSVFFFYILLYVSRVSFSWRPLIIRTNSYTFVDVIIKNNLKYERQIYNDTFKNKYIFRGLVGMFISFVLVFHSR